MKLGGYDIVRQVAEGGAATVYLSMRRCADGEKYCILKRLKRPARRYEDEAAYIGEIENALRMFEVHPNWVRIFDGRVVEGDIFFAMEYMDAGDLFRLKSRSGCVAHAMAVYAVREAAIGLHALHEKRGKAGERLLAVHRDVSPENILFHSSGAVKLGDFGIVQTVRTPAVLGGETIRGKFCYMSPEQAWGGQVDRRSDIFSLAVVLYEATTGRSFGLSDVVEGGLSQALEGMVEEGYPAMLAAVLGRALDIDREKRYPTAFAFKEALDEVMASMGNVTQSAWCAYLREMGMVSGEALPPLMPEDFESGMFLETEAAEGAANEEERLLMEAFEGCDELPPEKCLGVIRSVFQREDKEKSDLTANVSKNFSDLYESLNLTQPSMNMPQDVQGFGGLPNLPRVSMGMPQDVQGFGGLPNLPRVSMGMPQDMQGFGDLPNLPRVSMDVPQDMQGFGGLPNLPRVSMEMPQDVPQDVQGFGGLPNLPRVSMGMPQDVQGFGGLPNVSHLKSQNPKQEKKDDAHSEVLEGIKSVGVMGKKDGEE